MVLPNADGEDVARVNSSTRTIAIIMPNVQGIRSDDWRKYLATVDQVEALTGDDFFSNVASETQAPVESRLDAVNDTAPVTTGQAKTVAEDGSVAVTLTAADCNVPASCDYHVCDDGTTNGAPDPKCTTGTVNVTVNSVNDNPVAVNDSATTDEDNAVSIDLVANDTDVDGDTLTLFSVG